MKKFQTCGKAILRYPTNSCHQLMEALKSEAAFHEAINSKRFDEALLYVSPDLYSEFQKYKKDMLCPKDSDRMAKTLYKYFARSCTRSTPFASLAYCAVADIVSGYTSGLDDKAWPSLYFTYDMAFLQALCGKYLTDGIVSDDKMIVHKNPTMYKVGHNWNYYRQRPDGEVVRQEAESSRLLDYVIGHVIDRPRTIGECKELLSEHYEITSEQLKEFLARLLTTGIAISECAPNVVGDSYYSRLLQIAMRRSDEINGRFEIYKAILDGLNTSNSPAERVRLVFKLWDSVADDKIDVPKKSMLHIDAFDHDSGKTLSVGIADQVSEVRDFLARVTPVYTNSRLNSFVPKFTERYESETVPLLEVFDTKIGIGYGGAGGDTLDTFVRDVKLPRRHRNRILNIEITPLQRYLLKRIIEADGRLRSIDLKNRDLSEYYLTDNCRLGVSHSAMFRMLCHDNGAYTIDSPSFAGISGVKLAARFSNGSKEIDTLVREVADYEQKRAGLPLVEIAHYSNAHVGNISERPKFRRITLDCLSYTDADVLPLDDLSLRVVGGRIELFSRRLNSVVLPRLTTAHNYSISHWPIYKFLCDLQSQGFRAGLFFNWGGVHHLLDYTPRVTYGDVVLSRAAWRIPGSMYSKGKKVDIEAFRSMAQQLRLPRYMMYSEGDNDLFVDLTSRLSIESLLSALKTPRDIALEEFFPIESYDSVNLLECIIPFISEI